jgi:hypothetical protein
MNKTAGKVLALTILAISQLYSVTYARADIGPGPPTMDFILEYQTNKSPIIQAQLFLCQNASCTEKEPFVDPPGWFGRRSTVECNDDRCSVFPGGIGFGRYHQLVIMFEDRSRPSNVFSKFAYTAAYQVTVNESDLLVREVRPASFFDYFAPYQILLFLPALVLTLITELTVASIYSRKTKLQIRGGGFVNLISMPIVWFVIPFLIANGYVLFVISELFAIVFEASFLRLINRNTGLSIRQASIASVLMNAASIGVGIIAVFLFTAVIPLL